MQVSRLRFDLSEGHREGKLVTILYPELGMVSDFYDSNPNALPPLCAFLLP